MRPPKPEKPEGIETRGLVWRPRATYWTAYWMPRQDIADHGYPIKSRLLWPPANDPTATPDWDKIAAACELLQGEMKNWGTQAFGVVDFSKFFDGTFSSLITIYLKDPDSPYQDLRFQASVTYARRMELLRQERGHEKISTLTFRDFKRWYKEWRDPDGEDNVSYSYELIKFVRIAFHFGKLAKLPGCRDAADTLSEMEFELPKSRTEIVTPEHSAALRTGAHRFGRPSIALAQACQHGLIVRQKDVIGELIPLSQPGLSDIQMGSLKWLGGFRWEKLDQNMILEHRLSKSLRGKRALASPDAGKVMRWNLLLYPSVMEELCLMAGVPLDQLRRDMLPRSGPMVVAEHTGLPWRPKMFANKWREIARSVGIPENVQNRDSRAGGATDADQKGADIDRKKAAARIRPAMGHSNADTTLIYLRDQDEATARIAKLRFGNGGEDAS